MHINKYNAHIFRNMWKDLTNNFDHLKSKIKNYPLEISNDYFRVVLSKQSELQNLIDKIEAQLLEIGFPVQRLCESNSDLIIFNKINLKDKCI